MIRACSEFKRADAGIIALWKNLTQVSMLRRFAMWMIAGRSGKTGIIARAINA